MYLQHLLVDYQQTSTVASRVWVNTRRSFLVPMIDTILANRESGWRALTPTSRAADWPTWGNSVESFTWTRSFPERQIQRLMSHVHGTEPRTIRWHELPIEVLTSLVTGEEDTLDLHRCASCRAYSASLRRCAGCHMYRYCGLNWCVIGPCGAALYTEDHYVLAVRRAIGELNIATRAQEYLVAMSIFE